MEELRKSHTAVEEELKKTRHVKREKWENEVVADIEELKKSVAALEEALKNIRHVEQVQQVPSCDAQDQQTPTLPDKKTEAHGDIYNTTKMQHSSPVKILDQFTVSLCLSFCQDMKASFCVLLPALFKRTGKRTAKRTSKRTL